MSDSDNDANSYFVGGGGEGGSNQAVLAPKKNKKDDDLISALLDKAKQQQGGNHIQPNVDPSAGGQQPPAGPTIKLKVTFYKGGFTITDEKGREGPLVDEKSEEGVDTLQSFDKGRVPQSIWSKYPQGTQFDMELEDKKKEVYVKKFEAFEGSGKSLGGQQSSATSAAASQAASSIQAKPIEASLSESEPKGRVLLQLPDGTRRTVSVNPARHTIQDLFGEAAFALSTAPANISLSMRQGPGASVNLEAHDKRTLQESKVAGAAVFVKAN